MEGVQPCEPGVRGDIESALTFGGLNHCAPGNQKSRDRRETLASLSDVMEANQRKDRDGNDYSTEVQGGKKLEDTQKRARTPVF
jgi:hypothetical protein